MVSVPEGTAAGSRESDTSHLCSWGTVLGRLWRVKESPLSSVELSMKRRLRLKKILVQDQTNVSCRIKKRYDQTDHYLWDEGQDSGPVG